ncbi:MAG: hypothetical protein ABIQ86_02410 [Steroidobacteraceae bacterium]
MSKSQAVDLDALLDQSGGELLRGRDIRALGPSDSSDTGSDMMGLGGLDSTTDRNGTGERATVENDADVDSERDISVDGIVDAEAAGLGGGLDQAEEARLGITDEDIAEALKHHKKPL